MSKRNEPESTVRADNGQYTDGLDAVCVCGKRKGQHSAAKPHDCDETDCPKFKKAK